MLKFLSKTAWMTSCVLIWAVLVSAASGAGEPPLGSLESGLNDLIFDLSRSIVTVEASRQVVTRSVDGVPSEAIENLVSSGVICDTLGHILVAAANVAGKERIVVNFGTREAAARLIGIDYLTDLALLQVHERLGAPVRLSDRQVCAGQMVIELGNAFGLRAAPALGFCAGVRPDGTVQFSVPISASSVGGGVFDLSGRLLGVIVGTIGDASQVAVAVPAYLVPSIIAYLQQHGDRPAGYVGVSSADIEVQPPIEISSDFTLASEGTRSQWSISQGVVITYVAPSSPAAACGLQKGDLIIGCNGQRVISAATLASMVKHSSPGAELSLAYLRQSSIRTSRVLVGRKQIAPNSAFWDVEQFDQEGPSPDSLVHLLDYLKQEVTRLEQRLNRTR